MTLTQSNQPVEGEKTKTYLDLFKEMESLCTLDLPWESGLVSLIALLKEKFPIISWVGFYRATSSGDLWVGAYQGKLACLHIPKGKGVCGHSFERKKTILVPNVHEFPGHIACDAGSNSEIVVPLYQGESAVGVLDLDSYEIAAFNATDQTHLEKLVNLLSKLR